jgi:glyoxalase family protein
MAKSILRPHDLSPIAGEIATDPPGFTLDEPLKQLGTTLKPPWWFESWRSPFNWE